jgi:hypothetical protein
MSGRAEGVPTCAGVDRMSLRAPAVEGRVGATEEELGASRSELETKNR